VSLAEKLESVLAINQAYLDFATVLDLVRNSDAKLRQEL
jgi:hypothetical protein